MSSITEIEQLRSKLNRELARLSVLKEKSDALESGFDEARDREKQARELVDQLIERQRELNVLLDRAHNTLRHNQEVLAQASPQMDEMAAALPGPDQRTRMERLKRIRRVGEAESPRDNAFERIDEPVALEPEFIEETVMQGETAALRLEALLTDDGTPAVEGERASNEDATSFILLAQSEDGPQVRAPFELQPERAEAPSRSLDLSVESRPEDTGGPELDFDAELEPEPGFQLVSGEADLDGFRLTPTPPDEGPSLALQLEKPYRADDQPGLFCGPSLVPSLGEGFALVAGFDTPRNDLVLLACPPDHSGASHGELDLLPVHTVETHQRDVFTPNLSIGLDSSFLFTLTPDDAPSASDTPVAEPFPFDPSQTELGWNVAPEPEAAYEEPVAERTCPRCGRSTHLKTSVCPFCYAAMESAAAPRRRGAMHWLSGRPRG